MELIEPNPDDDRSCMEDVRKAGKKRLLSLEVCSVSFNGPLKTDWEVRTMMSSPTQICEGPEEVNKYSTLLGINASYSSCYLTVFIHAS